MNFFKFLLAESYTDEHHRARRQAHSGNNTSKAKTTTTMIKEIHKLLSEGRPRPGFDDFSRKSSIIWVTELSYAGSHPVGCRSHEGDNNRSKFACNTLIVGQKRCVA